MKLFSLILILLSFNIQVLGTNGFSTSPEIKRKLEMLSIPGINLKLRAGYFLEKEKLSGCVLFLQGLGDSINNHNPYFKALTNAGYRVISFDYLGQGGSEGSMNKTRVSTLLPPDATSIMMKKYKKKNKFFEIANLADFIWDHYSTVQNEYGESCVHAKKLVIGWSTGGLAAYKMAHEFNLDGVVLIAPGIHIKIMIGEAAESPAKMFFLKQVITERTLTRNKFKGSENPHLDPIRPKSPAHIPQFTGNLFLTSKNSHHWIIPKSIPGLVFLSGEEDTYVDRIKTLKTIDRNSSHFETITYDGALHELDNEISEVTDDLYLKTILFLNSI